MNVKNNVIRQIIKSTLFFILIFFIQVNVAFAEYKLKTVVLDAGHGGHDGGCTGYSGKTHEKNVVLNIALEVGKLIEKNYPDVKVVYTRKTDVFIPLEERAVIANKNKADLFISVHCNANPSAAAYGAETFIMGLHKTDANLDVALRENAVIKLEKDYQQTYGGFDPDSPESMIALSLAQNANIEQSSYVAGRVQNYFTNSLHRHNRSVKQAGFWVLYRTTCPSILVETGFLTNPSEEKYLVSEQGQKELAESIYKAFQDYKNYMEKTATPAAKPADTEKKEETNAAKPDEETIAVVEDKKPTEQPPTTADKKTPEQQPATTDKKPAEQQLFTVDTATAPIAGATPTTPIPPSGGGGASGTSVVYKVQLSASVSPFASTHKIYKSDPSIHYEKIESLYKYMTGPYLNYAEAVNAQKNMRNKGYSDAFVIVYKNGIRLTAAEAKEYLK
jgi:N-acetylmuramoyl-L-alanine amidase